MNRNLAFPLAALLALLAAGCVQQASAPAPATAPVTTPRPAPAPTASPITAPANWIDAPQTPGDWHHRILNGQSTALFNDPGGAVRVMLACDLGRGTVSLGRAAEAPGAVPMRIYTEARNASLSAQPHAGTVPMVVAALPARDPLLDAIAFSRGRFAVEVAGLQTLYLPSWPEITRVIEDCRP